ncbi:hypothetical protein HN018_19560 [Lichenicola cladoniae]|uniref:Uncharacterized protein n=1 Tax=Lichenicola cladoniae TaxID=1484109 RepID=A0A6M8HUL1_9PROT|nr:hypothetical protein [Lichenicola cladoniae]NPD66059.1 hypothetical protein [Acetobacteraceae bacterium]QKE91936.1 hypothetical protein HN018_19560 [Lichenicola cladoniae]
MSEIHRILEAMPDRRPLGRELGGLDATRCREAAHEQFSRIVHASMVPGMPIEDRRDAAKQGSRNRQFRAMAALLHALADHLESGDQQCGRIEMELADLKAGPERRVLIHGRKDFVAHTQAAPVLHLDATMPVAAVRMYLSRLEVPPPVEAVTPHMSVVQVLSTRDNRGGFGKTSVIPDPNLADDEIRRRERRLAEMRDFFAGMAQRIGPGLVITYKALRPYFAELEGVATANFNAISGLNSFLDVSWVVILGRPMPGPRDTALICKQLFGRWADPTAPEEVTVGLLMADGSHHGIRSRRFADEDMDAVRTAISDNNVVQSVGRPRGVRRTAESPVLVVMMNDIASPFPVHQVTDWPTIAPDVVQRMAARGAVLTSPKDAAKAYPDLFPSEDAAKKAILRCPAFRGQTPIIDLSIGECPRNRFQMIRYRPVGRGQQTRSAHVLESRLAGCRDWLEELLGSLALFEVTDPPREPPPPPFATSDDPPPWEPSEADLSSPDAAEGLWSDLSWISGDNLADSLMPQSHWRVSSVPPWPPP